RYRCDRDPAHVLPVHVLGSPRPGRRRRGEVPSGRQRTHRGLGGGAMSVRTRAGAAGRSARAAGRAAASDGVGRTAIPPVDLDHEELRVRRGPRTGGYVIVAIHSTALGPALGGARMWHYADPSDGIRDALRLARGMT